MAAFATNAPRPVFENGHAAPFSRLFARVVAWNKVRQTRDELMKLSERELDDIGLARGDIEQIARAGI